MYRDQVVSVEVPKPSESASELAGTLPVPSSAWTNVVARGPLLRLTDDEPVVAGAALSTGLASSSGVASASLWTVGQLMYRFPLGK